VTLEEMIDAVTVLIVLPDSVRAVVTVEVEGPILVERHKLLQILANLILNARDAVVSSGVAEPCIRIDAQCAGGQVEVVVTDNGVGIPASELPQIFGHGFTTKENGHGFGLHASAIAARELGGTLVAESDGDGRGARFCLTFPVTPQVPLRLIG
jgi:C4-dicarboxylate-specific signal transduction histidine kinase